MTRRRSIASSAAALAGVFTLTLLAGRARADGSSPSAPPPKPPDCSSAEHHQFDFWIGDWDVRDAQGKIVGHNRVEPILGGCVVEENWEGAGGGAGKSFNLYDRATKKWHQTWVDKSGGLLLLSGGLEDGRMVLGDSRTGRDGTPVEDRITWEKLPDGRVRQTWEASRDGGKAWKTIFDGFYKKKS
jgi:hypothetical protein